MVADNGGKAPTAPYVLLTILVSTPCPLSFCSCALANIPHQFLMHCHMVVLFFTSGALTYKYEKKIKMKQEEKSPSLQTSPHVICCGGFWLHQLVVKMF